MKSLVAFAEVMGARFYYLKRIYREHRKEPEFELVAERDEATCFSDKEALELSRIWGGRVIEK